LAQRRRQDDLQLHQWASTAPTAAPSVRRAPLLALKPHEVIAAGVACTFQNIELPNSMTVLENASARTPRPQQHR
jgi:ABC-type branched-subunit amino acid transport system ATPase component